MNYIAEKNGKKFRVTGVQVAAFQKAGYTVTKEATEETTATVKKAAKSKAKATETTDTSE
ncbi:MAG: hypothetical protein LUD78_09000 [Clostridiales bacterium]|nr:hypothetical protein [Clostridiales bacterium]